MDHFKVFIENKFIRRLLFGALVPFVLCVLAYIAQFAIILNYPISANQADWGTFGDFLGGVLNPIYAFLAFAGVVYTVILQKDQIDLMKSQKKLEEIQQLTLGLADTIDDALYQRKYNIKSKDPEDAANIFTILRAISDVSIRAELDPNGTDAMVYDDERSTVLHKISYDLTYIEEQLDQVVWCLRTYKDNNGSSEILDFYVSKYRLAAFMLKQIDHLHLSDVEIFFNVEQVKNSIIEALKKAQ